MDAAADFAFAEPVTIADIRAYALEAPCPEPIRTSFGMMRARPAVLVRIEDREGAVGWGEVWCNFPDGGGRHRAHLIRHVVGPLARDVPFARPSDIFRHLTRRLRILAIQTGEPGPLAQCAAALDIALWDLAARRRELPLWRWLGGKVASVPAYASGINPTAPERTVERAMARPAPAGPPVIIRPGMPAAPALAIDAFAAGRGGSSGTSGGTAGSGGGAGSGGAPRGAGGPRRGGGATPGPRCASARTIASRTRVESGPNQCPSVSTSFRYSVSRCGRCAGGRSSQARTWATRSLSGSPSSNSRQ